jgi:C-terminal processing protease CtpA/Prc
MSAAEDFTLALMERLPRVTRIGENTQGVVSEALDRKLPNGWTFSVPNTVYRAADGKAFDATGIPPDIHVPVFADEDVAAGRDPVMEAALKKLLNHEP